MEKAKPGYMYSTPPIITTYETKGESPKVWDLETFQAPVVVLDFEDKFHLVLFLARKQNVLAIQDSIWNLWAVEACLSKSFRSIKSMADFFTSRAMNLRFQRFSINFSELNHINISAHIPWPFLCRTELSKEPETWLEHSKFEHILWRSHVINF